MKKNQFQFRFKCSLTLGLMLLSLVFPQGLKAQDSEQLRQVYQGIIDNFQRDLTDVQRQGLKDQEVDTLEKAGLAYQYFGNYQKALELYQQAFAIATAIKDYNRASSVLNQMGNSFSKLGDYQGVRFYEEQLQKARNSGDKDLQIILLKTLGFAYQSNSEYIKAASTFEEYIALARPFKTPMEEALALSSLATAYGTARANDKLAVTLQEMVTIAKASGNPQIVQMALTLQSNWLSYGGGEQQAIAAQEQALQIARKNQDIPGELTALQQIALLYANQNNPEKVISTLEESLAIAQKIPPELGGTTWQTLTLDYLSRAYGHLGQYPQAIELQKQSLALYRNSGSSANSSFSQVWALENLGRLQFQSGNLTEARQTLQETLALHHQMRQQLIKNINLFAGTADDFNLNLREVLSDTYRTLQQIAIAQNQPQNALEIAEEGRARSFVELLATNLAPDLKNPPVVSPPPLTQLQNTAKNLKATLVEYSVIYNRPKLAWLKFGKEQPREIALYIWVIQPNGLVTFRSVDLSKQPNLSSLTDLVIATREAVSTGRRGIVFNEDSEAVARVATQVNQNPTRNRPLQQLHSVLIQPIADLLPQDPNAPVIFIPQDSVFLVPFPALRDAEGKYLIEKHTILTAPSIQVLDLTRQQRQQLKPAPHSKVLVVGNPQMPFLQASVNQQPVQLSSLPGAEIEAKAIAQLFQTQPLLGAQATETAIVQQMPEARMIHLATHGILDSIMGFQSSLALTPDGKQDGFLTARELLNLKLNAELVVLSACDTGRGRISGDGVIGLSRSFIAAGVPSLIVSLWKVPDEPTSTLMQSFYHNLQTNPNKAQALRQAMLTTKQQYPAPRDWAAFTLIGEAE